MFKLLTISLAGVRSLTISFLLLLLFLWLVGWFFFFFAFLWTKTNSRFIKTQETKKLGQWNLLYGQNRFFCSDSQTQGRIFFMSLAHVRKQVKFGCLGEGEGGG